MKIKLTKGGKQLTFILLFCLWFRENNPSYWSYLTPQALQFITAHFFSTMSGKELEICYLGFRDMPET